MEEEETIEYYCELCEDTGIVIKTEWVRDDEHGDMDYEVIMGCNCRDE